MAPRKKTEAKTPSASTARENIRQALTELGYKPQAFRQDEVEGFILDLEDERYESAIAMLIDNDSRFLFTVDLHDKGAPNVLLPMAEFLARVNFGLLAGTFEMDFEDGSARYRASLDFEGAELSPALVRNIVLDAGDTCQCYVPALVSVMRGEATAQEAFDAAEPEEDDE